MRNIHNIATFLRGKQLANEKLKQGNSQKLQNFSSDCNIPKSENMAIFGNDSGEPHTEMEKYEVFTSLNKTEDGNHNISTNMCSPPNNGQAVVYAAESTTVQSDYTEVDLTDSANRMANSLLNALRKAGNSGQLIENSYPKRTLYKSMKVVAVENRKQEKPKMKEEIQYDQQKLKKSVKIEKNVSKVDKGNLEIDKEIEAVSKDCDENNSVCTDLMSCAGIKFFMDIDCLLGEGGSRERKTTFCTRAKLSQKYAKQKLKVEKRITKRKKKSKQKQINKIIENCNNNGAATNGASHLVKKSNKMLEINQLKKKLNDKSTECSSLKYSIKHLITRLKAAEGSSFVMPEKHPAGYMNSRSKEFEDQKLLIKKLRRELAKKNYCLIKMIGGIKRLSLAKGGKMPTAEHVKQQLESNEQSIKRLRQREEFLEQHCKDIKVSYNEKLWQVQTLKNKFEKLKQVIAEMETNFEKQINIMNEENLILKNAVSISSNHELCEEKSQRELKQMKETFFININFASQKLTAADLKIKELYGTIEKFLRKIHADLYGGEMEIVNQKCDEITSLLTATTMMTLNEEDLSDLVMAGKFPKLNDWLKECKEMVYRCDFSDDLVKFLLSIMKISRPEIVN